MKKYVYALFLCLIVSFFTLFPQNFSSAQAASVCQNAFRIERKAYASGEVMLSYIFPVNSKLLTKEGFSDDEIAIFKMYLSIYVNALAKSNAEKVTDGVTVGGAEYFEKFDGFGFSILFDSVEAQKKFFGGEESSSAAVQESTSGIFVRTTVAVVPFPISSTEAAEKLKLVCLMAVSSWCDGFDRAQAKKDVLTQNYADSVFVYDFATQSRSLKSETHYYDGQFYHNVFCKSIDEIESDPSITFWVKSPNRALWCILSAGIVCFGMLCAGIIIKNKKKMA
jgi:hypothetical protein